MTEQENEQPSWTYMDIADTLQASQETDDFWIGELSPDTHHDARKCREARNALRRELARIFGVFVMRVGEAQKFLPHPAWECTQESFDVKEEE